MSVVAKIVIPIVIIAGLVWLYMAKYPSMVAQTRVSPPATEVTPMPLPPSQITTDVQLDADLGTADAELKAAGDSTATAQEFKDTPVAQTE